MKKIFIFCFFLSISNSFGQKINPLLPDFSKAKVIEGLKLVWQDEFNEIGKPNPKFWKFEKGFVRNEELQWYQEENANCKNGVLLIEGKRVQIPNPNFEEGNTSWRKNRKEINFTSASIQTKSLQEWQFGTFIIRARIDTTLGSWPAIWTLGNSGEWPSNGEIDLMEFYRVKSEPTILANVAHGTNKQYVAKWDDSKTDLKHFTDKNKDWVKQFHIWRMDWTPESINLYLDDELLNTTSLSETINPDGKNPFLQPHFLLLNLAIGGQNGGEPKPATKQIKYEVDYVRVYQKQ
ncbi:glycoside hydrolase family 16 protein [Emticicia sp. W12TSBA100-4]|uniref:glycoside hydrolase family 16 protein n=1 Tax=Emticicia sp. W12TSBA100-4 TaxID=3160965 RepID=UPI00330574C0